MLQNLTSIYINIKEVSHHNGLSTSILQTAPPPPPKPNHLNYQINSQNIQSFTKRLNYHMI